jgi:uncharacterized BrkB/YihY/UPF0761 family membrane protein
MIKSKYLLCVCVIGVPVCFLLTLTVVSYPEYWVYYLRELSPLSWFHSILLYTIGLFGLYYFIQSYNKNRRDQAIVWGLWSAAFFYLTVDERFALHERIRDQLLSEVNIPLLWTAPGDIVLLLILVITCIFLHYFFKVMTLTVKEKQLLFIAITLTSVAIFLDSLPFHEQSIGVVRNLQVLEEWFETIAMSVYIIFCIEVYST